MVGVSPLDEPSSWTPIHGAPAHSQPPIGRPRWACTHVGCGHWGSLDGAARGRHRPSRGRAGGCPPRPHRPPNKKKTATGSRLGTGGTAERGGAGRHPGANTSPPKAIKRGAATRKEATFPSAPRPAAGRSSLLGGRHAAAPVRLAGTPPPRLYPPGPHDRTRGDEGGWRGGSFLDGPAGVCRGVLQSGQWNAHARVRHVGSPSGSCAAARRFFFAFSGGGPPGAALRPARCGGRLPLYWMI